jgi:hypothetical protein
LAHGLSRRIVILDPNSMDDFASDERSVVQDDQFPLGECELLPHHWTPV